MDLKLRKIYLHLNDQSSVHFSIKPLGPRDRQGVLSHCLEFRNRGMYTRIWINKKDMGMRRDLLGIYLTDYRHTHMSDKIICSRAMRDEIGRKRPEVGFCQWREIDDDD